MNCLDTTGWELGLSIEQAERLRSALRRKVGPPSTEEQLRDAHRATFAPLAALSALLRGEGKEREEEEK